MSTDSTLTEVFKALGDPIRWSIVQQVGATDELACASLEDTLPVSKPTISYHARILQQVGLISARKEGRNFYYTLRRDVLSEVMDSIWAVAPSPRPVREGHPVHEPAAARRRQRSLAANAASQPRIEGEVALLTW